MKLKLRLNELVSFVASLSLLVNSLLTPLSIAYAQDATQTPEPTPIVEEAPTPTPEPTETPVILPTPEETVTPVPTVEETATPTPEETIVPTFAPESTPTTQAPPEVKSEQVEASSTPTVIPDQPKENGHISAVVLSDTSAASIPVDDLTVNTDGSATLQTDKADYAPTDAVLVTGTGFLADKTYKIIISSSDSPAITHEDNVTADSEGKIIYSYQLDGNYRPNYKVEIKDGKRLVASTTFTDGTPIAWPSTWITPVQCSIDVANDVNPGRSDLVGDMVNPAVGYQYDSSFWYFRERIGANPSGPGGYDQSSWSLLFQKVAPYYQYQISLNGKTDLVELWENSQTVPAPSPVDFSPIFSDDADIPLWSQPAAGYSSIVGNPDGTYYVQWAIPTSILTAHGISDPINKYFVTSEDGNNHNKDHLNCYEAMADLSIAKSDNPDPITDGGTLTYTLSIHNAGPDTASGVVVSDTLPTGYSVTSVTPSQGLCSNTSAPSIQCELGVMANGADATITIIGTLTGTGTVTNNTSVTLDTAVSIDTNQANNSDSENTTINPAIGELVVHKAFTDQHSNSGITINVTGQSSNSEPTDTNGNASFSNLSPGTYTAYATEPEGYYESANGCVNVSVTAGQTTNCTITDSPILGSITVQKIINGTVAAFTNFCFTLSPDPGIGQICADVNGYAVFTGVPYGTYDVFETQLNPDYNETSNTCSQLSISRNGDSPTCEVTNTRKQGRVSFLKLVDDQGDVSGWTFTINGVAGTFYSGDLVTLDTGSYIVNEFGSNDYLPDNVGGICQSLIGNSATMNVDEQGGTCIFSNSVRKGSVTIVKNAIPDDPQDFSFDATGSGVSNFTLDDDGDNSSEPYNTKIFSNLLPDAYSIFEVLPVTGWDPSLVSCDSTNGNDTLGIGSVVINLSAGENVTCTFTNTKRGSISGMKWNDLDGDGILDPGEPGVGSVNGNQNPRLKIGYQDASGNWIWNYDGYFYPNGTYEPYVNIIPGTYWAFEYNLPAGWSQTYPDQNAPLSPWGDRLNGPIVVAPGDNIQNVNFGNFQLGTISGQKFNDLDQDGVVDPGELGLPGWTIFLDENSDNMLDPGETTTTTDGDGNYTFTGLTIDSYSVCEVSRPHWLRGGMPETCLGVSISQSGQNITNVDFGNYAVGYITVYKDIVPDNDGGWFDLMLDGNSLFVYNTDHNYRTVVPVGQHQVTEQSGSTGTDLSNYSSVYSGDCDPEGYLTVAVGEEKNCTITNTKRGHIIVDKITNPSGESQSFDFTVTGAGYVNFSLADTDTPNNQEVVSGEYSVSEGSVAGWDSDGGICDQGETPASLDVEPGETVTCIFTNTQRGLIQGKKFEDRNNTGTRQGNEPYLNGWTIKLYEQGEGWQYVEEEVTGHTGTIGQYRFGNLEPGTYLVCEDLKPGWMQTAPIVGTDYNGTTCHEINLAAGGQETGRMFGNFELGKVQGMKFNDEDGDGEPHESGEDFMNTWTIKLYRDWVLLDQAITSNTGNLGQYRFVNLEPGTYQVCEVLQPSWAQTWPSVGDIPVGDNGVTHSGYGTAVTNASGAHDEADVCWQSVISTSGQFNQLLRFGNARLRDIHGYKWNDLNGDGIEDGGEPKLSGWEIFIDKNDDSIWNDGEPKTITSSNPDPVHFGWYLFENLLPGTYKVCEVEQGGWDQTSSPVCHTIVLPEGELSCTVPDQVNATYNATGTCNFGNQEEIVDISIDKSNDKSGGASAGDIVNYTLVVTNNGNQTIYNLDITDALPGGFAYVSGSTTGDTTADPLIAGNNLTWSDVTDLAGGAIFTIHYQVKIAGDVTAGTYKNFATCDGDVRGKQETIDCNVDDSSVALGQGYSYGGNLAPQVLGAATELPATGNSTWILLLAVLLGMAGIGIKIYAKK